ncbi:transaldolase [Peptoniphilus koenoeneniae]|uniref:Probable transaldolase n=1 Tax=Peptoniphilus koenoeneniae TaxID=507751 RepID=A0ABU0ATP6_9FIRM|nr:MULTISPECIES: fructose-6-phosphate aldolase [Peptoniphilus]ERT56743.1 fructose-6-phosphate aldolase [Peptoniphilus sp. BV3C26]MDQ0274146.1 transaldolase [Peptoniphilus koenoeneniae]
MKFFIDTANIDEIKEINSWGILSGVTTNPTLIAKEGKVFEDVISEIAKIVSGPVSAEVISTDSQGMINEAMKLKDIGDNVIIKIPMTEEGLKAVSFLSKKGIKTNVTLVFSVSQAILAARAGATYISPFLGRLDDIGVNSKDLIGNISKIFEIYDIKTEIIAASIRTPNNILDSLLAGCDIATVPYKVFKQMVKHPLTDNGLDKFLNDFSNVKTKGDF